MNKLKLFSNQPKKDSLFNFLQLNTLPVLYEANGCPKQNSKISIVFGIKSMAANRDSRNALRRTWLDPKNWPEDVSISHVFLMGRGKLAKEELAIGDILQADFPESHYNLIYKGWFLSTYKKNLI